MRLDKFIAQQLGVSRAIAGREIRSSRVPSTAKSSKMRRLSSSQSTTWSMTAIR
jgi:16S rRNA U516 pseudouridylate synthase RsuA-like enzyme